MMGFKRVSMVATPLASTETAVESAATASPPISMAENQIDGAAASLSVNEVPDIKFSTNETVADAPPPWQLLWMRPRWEQADIGIDTDWYDNETDSDDNDDLMGIKLDQNEQIDKNWIPISNSSAMLTRREAQTVIWELHRRKKLILCQTKRGRRRRIRSNTTIVKDNTQASPQIHPLSPFISWWRSFTSSNDDKLKKEEKMHNLAESNENIISSTCRDREKPPFISISSSSKCKSSRQGMSQEDACPNQDEENNLSPPSSPTSFSTFSLQPTPKKNNNKNFKLPLDTIDNDKGNNSKEDDWSGNDDGGDSSPQIVSDTSLASSLLWGEDMTLTTVSEDEAAAYRFHQQREEVPLTSLLCREWVDDTDGNGGDNINDEFENDCRTSNNYRASTISKNGRKPHSDAGILNEEWDGYNNVTLSVTIFSTSSSTSLDSQSHCNMNERQRIGEVVVIEMISTTNSPFPNPKFGLGSIPAKHVSPPPPRLPSRGQNNARSSSAEIGLDSSDRSNENKSARPTNRRQKKRVANDVHENSKDDGETDDTAGVHTVILARRVLWWPSCILSEIRDAENRDKKNRMSEYPSFVSLGRTNRRKDDHDHLQSLSAAHYGGPKHRGYEEYESEKGRDYHRNPDVTKEIPQYSNDEDRDERAADAMEAVQSLNFVLGGGGVRDKVKDTATLKTSERGASYESWTRKNPTCMEHSINPLRKENKRRKTKVAQSLSMCVVTNYGQAHFFNALRVLYSGAPPKTKADCIRDGKPKNLGDLSNSFSELVFGSDLFAKMSANVLPLSTPHASVQLSFAKRTQNIDDCWSSTNVSGTVSKEAEYDTAIHSNNYMDESLNWSKLGLFDATIESSTIHLRTIQQSNYITGSCFTSNTSNNYLAVCGRGLRRIVYKESSGCHHIAHVLGGFVTFISLRHYAESRTICLPFAPSSIQPVYWSGMHFVALLGEKNSRYEPSRRRPYSMFVRVDSNQERKKSSHVEASLCDVARDIIQRGARFQCLPLNLPSVKESLGSFSELFTPYELDRMFSKAITVSSLPSSPPQVLLSFQADSIIFVVNHTVIMSHQDADYATITTIVNPGHRAMLTTKSNENMKPEASEFNRLSHLWCTGGQASNEMFGWSLVGTQAVCGKFHFICWDGISDGDQGPFIIPIHSPFFGESLHTFSLISAITPLMSYVKRAEMLAGNPYRKTVDSPPKLSRHHNDTESGEFSSGLPAAFNESIPLMANIIEGEIDDLTLQALNSIMPESVSKSSVGSRLSRAKTLELLPQEKSQRLLRHCSSWTALDDFERNRATGPSQTVVATLRTGSNLHSLTLRTNTIVNPLCTSFQTVLSWLCLRRDYHTAASVALSLLDDIEALCELRGVSKTLHKGLLDGIASIANDAPETLTSLADMAVACLIKGGARMSSTLEGFLTRNKLYHAPRASVMLIGTLIVAVSKEPMIDLDTGKQKQSIFEMVSEVGNPNEDTIWPIRCLMKVAVVRDCLPSAIFMLNATIPNELRWRTPKRSGVTSSAPRPSLALFLSLTGNILESSEKATRYFLRMVDEESGLPYWFSIHDDTRLALILLSIHGKRIMLQEPEIRMWILDRLQEELQRDIACSTSGSLLPNEVLREIVNGVFCNSECSISQGMDGTFIMQTASFTENEYVSCYRQDMLLGRDLLVPNNGGLDYNLVIAALLILVRRGCNFWRECSRISTGVLLNTVCNLAGRKSTLEPKFIFDGTSAIRQCAKVENLQAVAFLVGGKKGFIIECMDLLVANTKFNMTPICAETMLVARSLRDLKRTVPLLHDEEDEGTSTQHDTNMMLSASIFLPSESHRHVLWLLQEYVLNVHTYGEFDMESHHHHLNEGKVTPVFASRICFRAWYCLTSPAIRLNSALWLEDWLRNRLDLTCGKSPRRLACAALVRTLLWDEDQSEDSLNCTVGGGDDIDDDHDDDRDQEDDTSILPTKLLLASMIGFRRKFLVELSQACCGLLQSIPPHIAEELTSSYSNVTNSSCNTAAAAAAAAAAVCESSSHCLLK